MPRCVSCDNESAPFTIQSVSPLGPVASLAMLKSLYIVEDAVEALASYKGYMIEVSVAQGDYDDDPNREHFAAFSGVVDGVTHYPGECEHWTVSFVHDPDKPRNGSVTIWRDGYEGTDRGDEPERIVIRQRGLLIDVTAYI
jgi:hypothetical protein